MKKTILSALIGATVLVPAVAQAELSANVAATSNYLWRGMEQTGGAAATDVLTCVRSYNMYTL